MIEAPAETAPPPARYPPPDEATARDVFVAWEKLRLWFNAVLGVTTLAVAGLVGQTPDADFLRFAVICAVGANLCFCVGPVAEGYAALLGIARRAARVTVFTVGILAGGLFTVAALMSFVMRDF